jgi:DNA-binding IclR family transcriptional regulator
MLLTVRAGTGVNPVSANSLTPGRKSEDKVDGDVFSVNITVGKRFDIADGSFGMCFMASLDEDSRRRYLEANRIFAGKSEEQREKYRRAVDQVKERGYAITYGDFAAGIFGVSAPILDEEGHAILTISAFGATASVERDKLEPIARIVKTAADEASRKVRGL